MPPKTMDAFRDHGAVAATLTQDIPGAERVLSEAQRLGLDLDGVTKALVDDGVKQFADAADGLYAAVADKRIKVLGAALNGQAFSLPDALKVAVETLSEKARAEAWVRRLWTGDAGLWTGKDEGQWLGWLGAGKGEAIDLAALDDLKAKVKEAGFTHVLLLGMGGSSLGPEVLGDVCGRAKGSPSLLVLNSTDPTQIARFEIDDRSGQDAVRGLVQVRHDAGAGHPASLLLSGRGQGGGRYRGRGPVRGRDRPGLEA